MLAPARPGPKTEAADETASCVVQTSATPRLFRASGILPRIPRPSGVRAHGFEVPGQRRHGDGKFVPRMRRHLPVMPMLIQESLLNLHACGALAGKRPCPVDLKALPADRTAHVAIAFRGLTVNLHCLCFTSLGGACKTLRGLYEQPFRKRMPRRL